jgi:hypothetical protein
MRADMLQEEIMNKIKDIEKLEVLRYQFNVAREIKTYKPA